MNQIELFVYVYQSSTENYSFAHVCPAACDILHNFLNGFTVLDSFLLISIIQNCHYISIRKYKESVNKAKGEPANSNSKWKQSQSALISTTLSTFGLEMQLKLLSGLALV